MNYKGSLLLVDDQAENLELLTTLLAERGYRVRAVLNGPRALAWMTREIPDLILLDIKMPEMDGYEVFRRLKGNPKTGAVPVIFLSTLEDLKNQLISIKLGEVDYLTKPFRQEEVLARVKIHLQLFQEQKKKTGDYKKTGLSPLLKDDYLKKIQSYMTRETPFLNGNFSLDHMAKKLNFSRHNISEVLNSRLKKNFHVYVSELRIKYILENITPADIKYKTLLGIALECGFNSKSVFNAAFKRVTGMTPKQHFKKVP